MIAVPPEPGRLRRFIPFHNSRVLDMLMKVTFAIRGPGGILGLGKRRQQKSGQNGDNRYHHQQLNQSKSSFKGSRQITRWHVESSFLSSFSGG